MTCIWHSGGKPPEAPRAFYARGCVRCEEKRAWGEVTENDITPAEWSALRRRQYSREHYKLVQAVMGARCDAR